MDRHEAYKLLAATLAHYRERPFGELETLVGQTDASRIAVVGGGEFLVDVSVSWEDERRERIRVDASADAPSAFRMERLEEHIVVERAT